MNFAEAWAELLSGKRIRRKEWDKRIYFVKYGEEILEHTDMTGSERIRQNSELPINDLLETDWEIY